MQSFQKPENALKRADELLSVGQQEAALKILHSAIGHRRFRSQGWDSVQETIMIRHLQLCVDENKLRLARDGLHQYRIISQHANIQSLGKVITELRSRAEQKLVQAKQFMEMSAAAAAVPPGTAGLGSSPEEGGVVSTTTTPTLGEEQKKQDKESETDMIDATATAGGGHDISSSGGGTTPPPDASSSAAASGGGIGGGDGKVLKANAVVTAAAAVEGARVLAAAAQDLDLLAESPEDLLLSTLQIEVRSADARGLHQALRSVWDVYKMILDLLRTTPKLERVYHETARRAFLFCKENQRPQEFKRLCDVLRSHFSLVVKNRHKEDYEGLLRPDLHLETRMLQLVVAADLLLWRECAATAEDLLTLGLHDSFFRTIRTNQELFHRSREKLMRWLAIYYEKMAKVTWVADNYLFHALAWLKLFLHIKGYKRNASLQDLQSMASTVVLAVLAIPVSGLEREREEGVSGGAQETLLSPSSGSLEQQKRMAMLLGHSTLPTREALKNVLYTKDIVSLADESCQQLLALVESEFPPLKLCSLCEPLLDHIAQNPTLEPYVAPLKRVIFHKLIFQLSRVYATLSIKHFTTHICTSTFLPWSEAEKLFVALVQQQQQQAALLAQQQLAGGGVIASSGSAAAPGAVAPGSAAAAGAAAAAAGAAGGNLLTGGAPGVLCIRLDYATSAILFETPEAAAANVLKHQLANLARHLDKALHMISPGQSAEERLERELFIAELPNRLEAETRRMAERTRITHSRRLEKQEEQQRVEEERRRREAEQRRVEERQERERREEATRRREERRMQQEKIKQRSETAAQMLEEIKKIGGKASSTILIKGKQLGEINIDDVLQGNVDYDDLERAQLMQLNKEKLARQRQRRQNYRRVCHFIRACREEELPLLMRWQEETLAHDTQILLDMQNKHDEEHKAAFEAALEEKQVFEVIKQDKEAWVAARLKERQEEFEVQAQQQRERLTEVLKQQKIQRARVRKEEHLKRLKLEAERKRMEEEQKRCLEQMEKKRQEEEAKARRLAEQAARQMQRELEVEEKQRQLDKEILSNSGAGGGGRQGGGGGISVGVGRSGGISGDNNATAAVGATAATPASSPSPPPPAAAAAAGAPSQPPVAGGGSMTGASRGGGGVDDDWRRGGVTGGGSTIGGGGGMNAFSISGAGFENTAGAGGGAKLSARRDRLTSGRGGGGGSGGSGGAAPSSDDGFERWRSGSGSAAAGAKEGGGNIGGGSSSGAPLSGRPRVRLAAAAAALNAAVGAGPVSNNQPPLRMQQQQQQQQQNGHMFSRTTGVPPVVASGITNDGEGFSTTTMSRPGTG